MKISEYTDEELELLRKLGTSGRSDFRYAINLVENASNND
jgi:hypothetical protein